MHIPRQLDSSFKSIKPFAFLFYNLELGHSQDVFRRNVVHLVDECRPERTGSSYVVPFPGFLSSDGVYQNAREDAEKHVPLDELGR